MLRVSSVISPRQYIMSGSVIVEWYYTTWYGHGQRTPSSIHIENVSLQ
jgi:hypothetical protein